jgi:chromosomal replication initiation ATPase DnaA
MPRQLVLDLPARAALGREDFFVSPANATALAALDLAQWPGGQLLLIGPEGSGKTHLAHLWASEAGAALIGAAALASADIPALAAGGAVVVEDGETLAADRAGQTALFHLHNLIGRSGRLLVTATGPVRDWGLDLADLVSRLSAAPVARLDPPDDALLSAVLVKLFADRQITVQPALIGYLLHRMDRSIGAARDLVARLDALALAQGRAVNRALAAEVLAPQGAAATTRAAPGPADEDLDSSDRE